MRRGTEYFSRVIDSLDDLPGPVRHAYDKLPQPIGVHQKVIIPPQKYFFAKRGWRDKLIFTPRHTPQRTLFFGETQIVIIEETDPVQTIVIPLVDVVAVELMTVLLYSALDVTWIKDGRVRTVQIEYNSVGAKVMDKEIDYLRTFIKAGQPGLPLTSQHAEDAIQELPLKFRNYTHLSLLSGEQVWDVIYEPAIAQTGHRFQPYLAPNRVVILADHHLIMLADGLPNWRGMSLSSYQIEQHYYPRRTIQNITFEQREDLIWLTLSLGTAPTHHIIRLPLSASRAAALQEALLNWLPQSKVLEKSMSGYSDLTG